MEKGMSSVIVSLTVLLAGLGIVSAQNFSGFLSGIDPTLIILSILFVVFFAVFYFSTSKVFSTDKSVSMVISLCLSALVTYGINNIIDLNSWAIKFGISSGTLYTVASVLMIALVIFLFIRVRTYALFIIGGAFIILAIAGIFKGTTLALAVGLALIVIGALIKIKEPPEKRQARRNKKKSEKAQRKLKKQYGKRAGLGGMG